MEAITDSEERTAAEFVVYESAAIATEMEAAMMHARGMLWSELKAAVSSRESRGMFMGSAKESLELARIRVSAAATIARDIARKQENR